MKKELNFEINILPILDILSVLICFLLLTAVWIQLGTIDTKQAVGDNSTNGAQNPPSMWITVSAQGALQISFRDLKAQALPELQIRATTAGVDWNQVSEKIQSIHAQLPDLKTVVIQPEARANYGDVIKLMDQLKKNQLIDVGLSPLSEVM